MNVRYALIILFFLLPSYSFAQILSQKEARKSGLDVFFENNWNRVIYFDNINIDNLPGQKMPSVLDSLYYKHLSESDYKMFRTVDVGNRMNIFHLRSKQAKDGYLLVNERINDYISDCPPNESDEYRIEYILNNTPARTKRDVLQIIRLKEKTIREIEVSKEEATRIISVFISAR